jgi:conjugative transposon TraN protein
MKKIIILFLFAFSLSSVFSQQRKMLPSNVSVSEANIITMNIPMNTTTHIISPEPILYVDISNALVQGEISEKNICRIKPDSSLNINEPVIITIVTESFIQVYRFFFRKDFDFSNVYVISIDPSTATPLNNYNKLGQQDFFKLASVAFTKKRKIYNLQSQNLNAGLTVNNIFIVGDFLFFDLTANNKIRLPYNIDELRFKIKDKYSVNASVSQDVELKPLYQFYPDNHSFKHHWRNIYVFKKFTFPGQKVFHIEMTEKQISGRKVDLSIDYNQVLQSENLF